MRYSKHRQYLFRRPDRLSGNCGYGGFGFDRTSDIAGQRLLLLRRHKLGEHFTGLKHVNRVTEHLRQSRYFVQLTMTEYSSRLRTLRMNNGTSGVLTSVPVAIISAVDQKSIEMIEHLFPQVIDAAMHSSMIMASKLYTGTIGL
ncbi:MAG: hypothetical protein FCKEOINB_00115 [Nitrosomonas sp.]|nr:hypothetical protein [Nitrosomonas sp.]